MTNAEFVRNLSVDQLADFLLSNGKNRKCEHGGDTWKYWMEVTVDWLNMECQCTPQDVCDCTEWR